MASQYSILNMNIVNVIVYVCVCARAHSLRPPFSSGDGEESEQGPSHVVVVKIVLLPLTLLRSNLIPVIHEKLAPARDATSTWARAAAIAPRETPGRGLVSFPPAVALKLFGNVGAIEEATLEQLHGHHGEDEHEQHVDDQNVQDVLQRIHHAVKHGLHREKKRVCVCVCVCFVTSQKTKTTIPKSLIVLEYWK